MASREPVVRGAAPNVDLRETDDRRPYERDVDEPRIFDCTCITCDAEARVWFETGRDRAWEHDREHTHHLVEYWRVDR